MSFRFRGLDPAPFRHLYGLSDTDLAALGAKRYRVETTPGSPDRIEVRDMAPGETAILVNHLHQPADTPYRASHAIFVREGADTPCDLIDRVPEPIRIRPISLRAFDAQGMMVDADLVAGAAIDPFIARFLVRDDVAYLHAHYAQRGCYAALIERA